MKNFVSLPLQIWGFIFENYMKMKRILVLSVFALTFLMTSCSDPMVGSWVMPATNYTPEQGFELKKDGTAEAINMEYVEFTTWQKAGNKLILNGKNTGSVKGDFSDEMNIVEVTKEEMKIETGGVTLTYKKKEF